MHVRTSRGHLGHLSRIGAAALAAVTQVTLAAEVEDARTRYVIAAPRLALPKVAALGDVTAPATRLQPADPSTVSAAPCVPCTRDAPNAARALIPALPAGESYEVRVLKSAVHGFTFRLSGGESPASPDERLRIRLSRDKLGIAWQRSF